MKDNGPYFFTIACVDAVTDGMIVRRLTYEGWTNNVAH